MPTFLSLPPEIRIKIYRELRSLNSPLIKTPFQDDSNALGYCSYAFHSRILETCHQISEEAKEIFYGENYWTFFASQRDHFSSTFFQAEPMVLVLPFIRKAHIRFRMLHWLSWESYGLTGCVDGPVVKANIKEICQVLLTAPALRTVKIIWTETGSGWPMKRLEMSGVRRSIADALRPLLALPATSELQKSNIMVAYVGGGKAKDMELDFSECVDEVIGLHRFKKTF